MAIHRDSAVVIGSGPNGLAAATALARAGLPVLVLEAEVFAGGGARTAELTLSGFLHDICSAVHPLAVSSPYFRRLPLGAHGLEWIHPPVPLAHPLDDGTAVLLHRSIDETCDSLGMDGREYRRLMMPLAAGWPLLAEDLLAPPRVPRHPFLLGRFGLHAWRDVTSLAKSIFRGQRAQALFAGLAAHSTLPLERRPSAAFALLLGTAAHAVGWPIARGGSARIAEALIGYLRSMGGEVRTGKRVNSVDELAGAEIIVCDVTPRELLSIAGHRFSEGYRQALERYQYGPGVFKVDWALDGPIPWTAKECRSAGTIHLGGTREEIARSERMAWSGETDSKPFVLLAQPSLFDPSRAPAGKHTAWAYCHVPNGSTMSMLEAIENQVERFAPGFRKLVLARHVMGPSELWRHNSNLIGGSITGGVQDFRQTIFRPTRRLYSTPAKGIYICSSSTPPGGGVHGMCGYFAARRALLDVGQADLPSAREQC
ncbi:MAG: phytoene desaturase family protein [Terriglobia bacterium]